MGRTWGGGGGGGELGSAGPASQCWEGAQAGGTAASRGAGVELDVVTEGRKEPLASTGHFHPSRSGGHQRDQLPSAGREVQCGGTSVSPTAGGTGALQPFLPWPPEPEPMDERVGGLAHMLCPQPTASHRPPAGVPHPPTSCPHPHPASCTPPPKRQQQVRPKAVPGDAGFRSVRGSQEVGHTPFLRPPTDRP